MTVEELLDNKAIALPIKQGEEYLECIFLDSKKVVLRGNFGMFLLLSCFVGWV